jgi:tripartite-type tricarboxylate transporter receptor subunit TctC
MVASSKPDGYTVGHVPLGSFINNYLMYDVAYNPSKNFTFIGGVARYAESIVVRSDAPWKSWQEFIDHVKAHPNEVKIGFSGAASSNTIAAKWIGRKLGLKWNEVTFPGDAEGITALLGGHIDAFPGAGPQNMLVKDGRARMLLALTIEPIPGFPDIPTFKQVFGKETMNASGLMGPAGIPGPVLSKLEKAVQEGTKDPGFLKAMEQMNMTPLWRSSKEFAGDVQTALVSFQDFLRDLGMLKKEK